MSTPDAMPLGEVATALDLGGPQLSTLGKRIEMMRVDRGVSKQTLARAAGTSRQQLWRVMTGKSELTSTLCQRLATVLDVDSRTLSSAATAGRQHLGGFVRLTAPQPSNDALAPDSLAAYLRGPTLLLRTFATLPSDADGAALKCALLNALEQRALQSRTPVPTWLFRVRANVITSVR